MEKGSSTKKRCLGMPKKIYDGEEEVRRRVENHLRYSPKHSAEFQNDDEAVNKILIEAVEEYMTQTVEEWDEDEWFQEHGGGDDAAAPGTSSSKGAGRGSAGSAHGGPRGLQRDLAAQIATQTANMLHFSRAASMVLNTLRTAHEVSMQAANSFQRQLEDMEEGCENMIQAFGISPQTRTFDSSSSSARRPMKVDQRRGRSDEDQIDLARNVRGRYGPR